MKSECSVLRDFTVDSRVWLLSGVALFIGVGATFLAVLLLRLIAISTNLFYYHRFSLVYVSPAGSPLGHWMVVVPVVGGLIVGLMAHFGSDKIRGHGIPEAIEAILLNRARVDPKIAILKPISAAIAIGSGGPFGAEGPIIMTGGAFGSLIAQWIRLTDAERTTLLVAGAAAGMSATFATPVAAILLAVELLLFELRPRSLGSGGDCECDCGYSAWISAWRWSALSNAGYQRGGSDSVCSGAVLLGAFVGLVAAGMSRMMYAFEDLFERLPIHWMWWPALGGIGIGVGGLFFPRGLGVGYDNIAELLRGNAPIALIVGILFAKSLMWAFSLGSGTSGGVLAPLLMIGGAVGAMAGHFGHASLKMQACLGADWNGSDAGRFAWGSDDGHSVQPGGDALSAGPGAAGAGLCFGVSGDGALMPRSILTEKLSRRGYHLTREYGIDPLEIVMVRDMMSPVADHVRLVEKTAVPERFIYADCTCRSAAELMATEGVGHLLVADRATQRISGAITLHDLLKGRNKSVVRETEMLRLASDFKGHDDLS